jgi:hypothetical protein
MRTLIILKQMRRIGRMKKIQMNKPLYEQI